jgi:uncharacterized repeat protein (TIGR04076 family)
MKRRDFITTAAFGAAGALASSVFSQGLPPVQTTTISQTQPLEKTKITVLKRTMNDDGTIKACTRNQDGQEFIIEFPGRKPDRFCDVAWEDVRNCVEQVGAGGIETSICSCTGSIHVVFKIERMKS